MINKENNDEIELKVDAGGDIELYIHRQFLCAWEGNPSLYKLIKDKDLLSWFKTLMRIAIETGNEQGIKETQEAIKNALDI